MPILANNTKKVPTKMRVERVPFEARTIMPDGRAIIHRLPMAPRLIADLSSNPVSAEAREKRLQTVAAAAITSRVTMPKYTISDRDWKTWEPVFQEARDKFNIAYGSKSQLEKLMEAEKRYDGYRHWGYTLRYREVGALNLKFALQSSGRTPRFVLLAAMYVRHGQEAQLVTRTSIAHHARVGCSMWSSFSPADCEIKPCCGSLCRDVPGDGETSRYEQGLHLAKKDLELAEARAARERLARQVRELVAANRRLTGRGAGPAASRRDLREEVEVVQRSVRKRSLDDGELDEEAGRKARPGGNESVVLKRRRTT